MVLHVHNGHFCPILDLICIFVVRVESPSHCPSWTSLHHLDLQNMSRGRAPTLPSLWRATQSAATVARFSYHQLCWYLVPGSSHCPTRGSSGEFYFWGIEILMWRISILQWFSLILSPFSLSILFHFLLDWLHVWQRCVLCWHGVQECKLLSHFPVRPYGPVAAGWSFPWQHVSEIRQA